MTRILHGSATRRPFDVSVSPESYSFRLCRVIRSLLETCPLCRLRRHNMTMIKFYPLPSLPTLTKYFICYSVSAFSFYLKKKTPAKEKQTQGFAPRPRERRAAVHSLLFSVGSSAHSPANALELERVRARAACKASRSALSKHSRLSPLERALCSLFFANIASLYPPPAALRRRCPQFSDSFYHCGAAIGGLFLGGYKVVDFTFLCFFAGEPSSTPRSVKKKRQRSGSSIRCRRTFFI